jgi:TPR repeat protein
MRSAIVIDHAISLYRLAAAQNFDGAQRNMANIYATGFGVDEDHDEALRWSRLNAAQEHPEALFHVAACHDHGLGRVITDKAEAIRWYSRAQAAGSFDAAAALRRL